MPWLRSRRLAAARLARDPALSMATATVGHQSGGTSREVIERDQIKENFETAPGLTCISFVLFVLLS
eukprot:282601-Pleurochrysis_carterae.AAC.1